MFFGGLGNGGDATIGSFGDLPDNLAFELLSGLLDFRDEVVPFVDIGSLECSQGMSFLFFSRVGSVRLVLDQPDLPSRDLVFDSTPLDSTEKM